MIRNRIDFKHLSSVQKHLFALCLFIALATILIFSWFRYGHLYGGGDVGIPSYDPNRILNIAKFVWWDASAPGVTVPQGLTSVPFQFVQSTLQNFGLSFVYIQALFFWTVVFFMGYGMFLVAVSVLDKDKFGMALLSGLIYVLNPYMEISVWHRFIHNTFFLAVALPFFFLFFKSWLKSGKYKFLLLFLLVNFIVVYLYGTIAFIATILILLLFICAVEVLLPWKGFANFKLVAARGFLGIAAWLAIHSWWMLPVFSISPIILSLQHSVSDNLATLIGLSSQTIMPYTLIGVNPYYLYTQADFGKLYDSFIFRALPWLLLVFLVPGFYSALKNKKYILWPILALIGIYLAKGATSPFGYPYIFGFSNFFSLGVLRNPFEKMGIYIPFAYAILIPLGVDWYLAKRKKIVLSKLFITVVLILILVINLWPMWLGRIFGRFDKQAFVQVPNSYIKADEFIKKQNSTGRILHLPLTVGESATYNWEYGYSGVESSQLYFKSLPSISRGINQGGVDNALTALSYIFLLPDSKDKILNFLQSFSVRFIVLHKDMEWHGGYLQQPQILETSLDRLNFLDKKVQFGDLIVYELKDKYFRPKIKLTNKIQILLSSGREIYWPWLLSSDEQSSSSNKSELLTPMQDISNEILINKAEQLIAFPERVYEYKPQKVIEENLLGEITAAKVLPDSPFYQLIRLKEKMQYLFLPVKDKFSFEVTLAGKRLTESYLLKEKGSTKSIVSQVREYQAILSRIKDGVEVRSQGKEGGSIQFILSRHLAILNLIKERASADEKAIVEEALNKLMALLKETSIVPYNQILEENLFPYSHLVSRFVLPVAGKYELLQAHQQTQNIYPDSLITNTFQINSEVKNLQGVLLGQFISYGSFDLPAGINEISYDYVPSINLAHLDDEEIELTSDPHSSKFREFNIDPVLGGDDYQLIFESFIKLGDKFIVQIFQDTDLLNPKTGEIVPSYSNLIPKGHYENYWTYNVLNFHINPATTKATVRFLVAPWDGCKYYKTDQPDQGLCKDKILKFRYEKSSKVSFKNIKVVRPFINPMFLKSELRNSLNSSLGKVSFTQKSAASYSGKVNLESAGFLIFNESYHPGWALELTNGKKIIPSQKFLSNLYGNAWYIENPGEYNFKLEFVPQRQVKKGIIISVVCFLITSAFAVKQKLKND